MPSELPRRGGAFAAELLETVDIRRRIGEIDTNHVVGYRTLSSGM